MVQKDLQVKGKLVFIKYILYPFPGNEGRTSIFEEDTWKIQPEVAWVKPTSPTLLELQAAQFSKKFAPAKLAMVIIYSLLEGLDAGFYAVENASKVSIDCLFPILFPQSINWSKITHACIATKTSKFP